MNLQVFQSAQGDCLLLEAKSGELFLCDGGMRTSMTAHVRAELAKLRVAGKAIEFAYVSHIDNDHILGVLQLLEDEVEWRVFDHHKNTPTPVKQPKVPRPPEIKGILHNAFRDQVSQNKKALKDLVVAREIRDLLSATAPSLYATAVPKLIEAADEMQAIATAIPEALKVTRLAAADALNIPVNKPPGVQGPSKLLFAGQPGDTFDIGTMHFTLIGPTDDELRKLRTGWINWLKANKDKVKALRAELKKRIDEFSTGALTDTPFDLGDWNGVPDHKSVTAPNIASLMFMVEEDDKRLLLTGDGHQDFIIAGLQRTGFMTNGSVHLEALKVQHHGSEHNFDVDFGRRVSADNYVFCGNGHAGNPEIKVINMVHASRLGNPAVRALSPKAANRPFHFWFSTTSQDQPPNSEARKAFAKVEQRVAELAAQSNGQMHLHFNQGAFATLSI